MEARAHYLLQQFINREATEAEREELFTLLRSGKQDQQLLDLIDQYYNEFTPAANPFTAAQEAEMLRNVFASDAAAENKTKTRNLWPRIAAAASLLIGIGIISYFLMHKAPKQEMASNSKHDVAPYTRQAVLKTHGKTIQLDSTHKGTLARYVNTHIQKNSDQLTYTNSSATQNTHIYDTLQVPAGGKPYHLKLADGSQVIVNVASTLRYPENFRNNNNKSELELIAGEAYFAIVHNTKAPLTIKAANQTIEDIGTEFNVNTYSDEPGNRTTLVEGSIKVNTKSIKPGEQAIIVNNTLTIATANIGQTIAWKEGFFRFNGEKIQTVMRELARWYNIEVKYEGKPSEVGYFLKISRSKNISEVLKVLERTNGAHFKIEGRRVTVLSKK